MKYPFVFLSGLFAAGVGLSHLSSTTHVGWNYLCFALSLAAYSAARLFSPDSIVRPRLFLQISVIVAFLSAGSLADILHHGDARTNVSRWTNQQVRMPLILIGRARQFSYSQYSGAEFALDVSDLIHGPDTLKVSGVVLVGIRSGSDSMFLKTAHPGDVFEVTGELQVLPAPRNPFDFDQEAFLRSKGFSAVFSAVSSSLVSREHAHSGLPYRIEQLRNWMENRIVVSHRSLYSNQLLPALLIGRRDRIDTSVRNHFRKSGLSHLLAISGLHVGIIGVSLYWVLGIWLTRVRMAYRSRQWSRAFLVILVLTIYACITGGSTSVVRAVIMATVFIYGSCSERKIDGRNSLGLAVLIILVLNPEDLFSPGLQLSVSALAGIFLFLKSPLSSAPGVTPGCPRKASGTVVLRRVYQSVGMTSFILVFTTPVLLYHFGESPLGGLFSNVVAIPVTGLLLFAGILSTSAGPDAWMPFTLFSDTTDLLAAILVSIAHGTGILAESATITASGRFDGFVGSLPLAASFFLVARFIVKFRFLTIAGILSLLIFQTVGYHFSNEKSLSASFFDVGQGDAALFMTPGDKSLLVDTGRGYTSAQTIKRHLRGIGITGLDALVITHPHIDHIGGLSHLIEDIDVRHIYAPDVEPITRLISTLSVNQDIPVTRTYVGNRISIDPSVRIRVLAPRFGANKERPANDESIVLLLTYGKISILLMGDAELSSEKYLVRNFGSLLNVELIKVGHHGSKTSSSFPFVRRVTGLERTISVVSVGEKNRFGHPDQAVLRRWMNRKSNLFLTSRSGALLMRSDGTSFRVVDRDQAQISVR